MGRKLPHAVSTVYKYNIYAVLNTKTHGETLSLDEVSNPPLPPAVPATRHPRGAIGTAHARCHRHGTRRPPPACTPTIHMLVLCLKHTTPPQPLGALLRHGSRSRTQARFTNIPPATQCFSRPHLHTLSDSARSHHPRLGAPLHVCHVALRM